MYTKCTNVQMYMYIIVYCTVSEETAYSSCGWHDCIIGDCKWRKCIMYLSLHNLLDNVILTMYIEIFNGWRRFSGGLIVWCNVYTCMCKPILLYCCMYQMELNDELFRLTDVATEAIYPDAMIADCYIYLFNLGNKVHAHTCIYIVHIIDFPIQGRRVWILTLSCDWHCCWV